MSQMPTEALSEIADECQDIAEALMQISDDTNELLRKGEQAEILKYLATLPATLAELFGSATHKVVETAIVEASEIIQLSE